jgi:hypothetical protein
MLARDIETALKADEPLWLKLRGDDLTYRYGGQDMLSGLHTALLQGDPDHHGRRATIGCRYVKASEVRCVLRAARPGRRQGDSSAGLPGVMDMDEHSYRAGYAYGRNGVPQSRR